MTMASIHELGRDESGATTYSCHCGERFSYLTLLRLHEIDRHMGVHSDGQAVEILTAAAREFTGKASLTLTVDGVPRKVYDRIDENERAYGLGRSCKTAVLIPGVPAVLIRYVLDDDDADAAEVAARASYNLLLGEDTLGLGRAPVARPKLTVEDDRPVHRPAAPDAPIPGQHWYGGCDPDRPRVNADGTCEGCGGYGCPDCGREGCSGGTDCEAS